MYPRSNGQSCTYQQAFQGGVGIRTQQSVQTYSELKCDFSEEGRFRLRMCVIAAAGFVLNLIFTISLMIFLLLSSNNLPGDKDFVGCNLPERYEGQVVSVTDDRCPRLTKKDIRKAVLEDCDENSNDEIRVHPKNCQNFTKDELILTQWEIGLNQSSVSLDAHGQFTVHYSGVYIIQSSLAFECQAEGKSVPGNERRMYWHEIQVQNVTQFSDAEKIQPHSFTFAKPFCYRSYIYAVLKLQAKDSFRIRAGPTALIGCTKRMSYLALYRP